MELVYKSTRGNVLSLTDNKAFYLIKVGSQSTIATDLSSISIGSQDGDETTNVKAKARDIELDLRIKEGVDVETAKRAVLSIIKIKQTGTLLWTQNDRTLEIQGTVTGFEMERWEQGVTMIISLHCSEPFWEDVKNAIEEIDEALSLHYFTDYPNDMLYFPTDGIALGEYDVTRTRTLYNGGDVAVGLDIEIIAYETVTNPIIHDQHNNFLGVGYGSGDKRVIMAAGDVIKISTHKGKKDILLNGTSIISKFKPQGTWLQLDTGNNTFSIGSDDVSATNMTFTLTYKQRYI